MLLMKRAQELHNVEIWQGVSIWEMIKKLKAKMRAIINIME
jgi:hypothetical protein